MEDEENQNQRNERLEMAEVRDVMALFANVIVVIIEQPMHSTRYRYPSEGRYAGSIVGVNSTAENKTYPTIAVHNYEGSITIVVTCVTAEYPHRPHPHSLVSREYCRNGVYAVTKRITPTSNRHSIKNLGIQCARRRDVHEAQRQLRDKKGKSTEPSSQPFNLKAVRLCIQVYLLDKRLPNGRRRLAPLYTDVIRNKKPERSMRIAGQNEASGSVVGGTHVYIGCDRVIVENTRVVMYREREGERVWEMSVPLYFHERYFFVTPPYTGPIYSAPDNQIYVHYELRRTTDNACSNSLPFEYIPEYPASRSRLLYDFQRGTPFPSTSDVSRTINQAVLPPTPTHQQTTPSEPQYDPNVSGMASTASVKNISDELDDILALLSNDLATNHQRQAKMQRDDLMGLDAQGGSCNMACSLPSEPDYAVAGPSSMSCPPEQWGARHSYPQHYSISMSTTQLPATRPTSTAYSLSNDPQVFLETTMQQRPQNDFLSPSNQDQMLLLPHIESQNTLLSQGPLHIQHAPQHIMPLTSSMPPNVQQVFQHNIPPRSSSSLNVQHTPQRMPAVPPMSPCTQRTSQYTQTLSQYVSPVQHMSQHLPVMSPVSSSVQKMSQHMLTMSPMSPSVPQMSEHMQTMSPMSPCVQQMSEHMQTMSPMSPCVQQMSQHMLTMSSISPGAQQMSQHMPTISAMSPSLQQMSQNMPTMSPMSPSVQQMSQHIQTTSPISPSVQMSFSEPTSPWYSSTMSPLSQELQHMNIRDISVEEEEVMDVFSTRQLHTFLQQTDSNNAQRNLSDDTGKQL